MRVAIATLGCKVNQYDSAVIDRAATERGWKRVAFDDVADAYVVNTCTVTDRADSDARKLARRARRINPAARVILTGCYAQTSPSEITDLGYVDHVVGIGQLSDLVRAVEGNLESAVSVADLRKATEVTTLGIETFPGRTRAFVKIQEGCNLFCTYCIIPVARGQSRSVPARQVMDEITRLSARGFREVVLTGVHLGGYGRDLGDRYDLAFLLEALGEHAPDVRIRLSSIDPPEVTPRLLAVMAANPRICRHLHVPLQAGDDGVLARMKRVYRTADAARAFAAARAALDGLCIGTDVITGFPGETDAEFTRGADYFAALGLDYLHVFPYSERRATSAAKRWEPVAPARIAARAVELRRLDAELRRASRRRHVGGTLDVLFEMVRDRETGLLRGYSGNYQLVLCNAPDSWKNRIVDVDITQSDHRALYASRSRRPSAERELRAIPPDEAHA